MATLVAQHALKTDRYRKLRLIILTQQNFPFLYKAHTQVIKKATERLEERPA